MLKRYNDFLFESLLLESALKFSNEFRQILHNIDSPVAQTLIDIEKTGDDLPFVNNFIDVSDNKEEITFISDKKAQTFLKPEFQNPIVYYSGSGGLMKHTESNAEMFRLLGYEPVGDTSYKPRANEKGKVEKRVVSPTTGMVYLKVIFPGGISVINEEKVRYESLENLPFHLNRQPIRVRRGIQGILSIAKVTYPENVLDNFVDKYRSALERKRGIFKDFDLVSGEEIRDWYHENNYASGSGSLSGSCMRYNRCQDYLDIYVKNTQVCSLLILKNDSGKLRGRAIVWKLSHPSGIIYMDRTYVAHDSDYELFRQYAADQGWHRKPENNYLVSADTVDPSGSKSNRGYLKVQLKNLSYDEFPYVDTLKYYDPSDNTLSTSKAGGLWELTSTSGEYDRVPEECSTCSGSRRVDCDDCGGQGEATCGECDGHGTMVCDNCDGEGHTDCENCRRSGVVDGETCQACNGGRTITCNHCYDGSYQCPACNGDGTERCDNCRGRGRVDCPDCV